MRSILTLRGEAGRGVRGVIAQGKPDFARVEKRGETIRLSVLQDFRTDAAVSDTPTSQTLLLQTA